MAGGHGAVDEGMRHTGAIISSVDRSGLKGMENVAGPFQQVADHVLPGRVMFATKPYPQPVIACRLFEQQEWRLRGQPSNRNRHVAPELYHMQPDWCDVMVDGKGGQTHAPGGGAKRCAVCVCRLEQCGFQFEAIFSRILHRCKDPAIGKGIGRHGKTRCS
ncbi:hypothetical protein [Nitrosomonas sp. HPC101]|uniref:hypothetical protein n=1 Tax=Nitrosomonas sp. HPC101 TaxID=1658667 RepID=UPI00136D651C|nr:hypothetical protein [Nitrosomonas sp. HPC101]